MGDKDASNVFPLFPGQCECGWVYAKLVQVVTNVKLEPGDYVRMRCPVCGTWNETRGFDGEEKSGQPT